MLNPEKSAELSSELFELGKIELVRFLKLASSSNTHPAIENDNSSSYNPTYDDSQSTATTSALSSDMPQSSLSKRRHFAQGGTATSVKKRDTTLDEQIAKFICVLDQGDFVPDVSTSGVNIMKISLHLRTWHCRC